MLSTSQNHVRVYTTLHSILILSPPGFKLEHKHKPQMCYALLTTCHTCAWLLAVTYPSCSHAKAYALNPAACPHRMRRRYKATGLCSACKNKPDSTTGRNDRNESLSVSPCEVRIAFRDTEVGAVEEDDMVGGMKRKARKESATRGESVHEEKGGREIKAWEDVVQSRAESTGEDSDGDVYIDAPSPFASVSSASSGASRQKVALPRKHKAGARPSPRALPKAKVQTRKRRRSPGVLERLRMEGGGGGGAKKGKRRLPRVKMVWPDRIDAGEFEQVEQERRANEQKGRVGERPGAKPRKVEKQPLFGGQVKSYERRISTNHLPSRDHRQSYVSKLQELASTSAPSCTGRTDGMDNLARIIALEAARREKKWR